MQIKNFFISLCKQKGKPKTDRVGKNLIPFFFDMVKIKIKQDEGGRWSVIVEHDGKPAKGCNGSKEFAEEQAQRWAEQYGAEIVRE